MQLLPRQTVTSDYLAQADALAAKFAQTAIERDKAGGTPKAERDQIRASGLLNLVIPKQYGGLGESWITAMQITRRFAEVDSSIAHVFSYHHLGVIIPHIFGTLEQKEYYYLQTVQQNWFWCNALNPLDRRTTLTPEAEHFRLNGIKSFCSGSKDSDILPITAIHAATSDLLILTIPTQQVGILIQDDWDNMGQRQTDSGSIIFENVRVDRTQIIGSRNVTPQPFGTMRACLTQLNLANIYLGIAQGAFQAARSYTQTQTRPWLNSGVDRATADPYVLHDYGEMWMNLQAATHLVDHAGERLQAAWEQEWDLTAEQRGECAVTIATAKAFVTQTALEVTSKIFDVMGARSTSAKYGFDRYWRNLRVFTLHDPVDYKIRAIGNWALNHTLPTPDFYL